MLVESPDGGAALLGRSKKMRAGMLTCLSGFVDQVGWLVLGSAWPVMGLVARSGGVASRWLQHWQPAGWQPRRLAKAGLRAAACGAG